METTIQKHESQSTELPAGDERQLEQQIAQELHEAEESKDPQRIAEAETKIDLLPPDRQKKIKNARWRKHDDLLMNSITDLSKDLNRMPSKQELANHTGLSYTCVRLHMNGFLADKLMSEPMAILKSQRKKFLFSLMKLAQSGDKQAIQSCLQLMSNYDKEFLANPGQDVNINNVNINKIMYAVFKHIPIEIQDVVHEEMKEASQNSDAPKGTE